MTERPPSTKQTPTLEQRIATALENDNLGSAELSELVREAECATQTADKELEAERTKALDVVQSPNTEAAHQAVTKAVLTRERLRTSLTQLRDKLVEALAAEAQDRWLADFERVKHKRDEAASAFRRYRELSQEIVNIFSQAVDVDREIDRVNASAPHGVHQRLRHVENEARNVEFSRDRPSIAATVELRDWDNSGRMIWPKRHFGSLAAAFANSMITPATGVHWSEPEVQAKRRREIEHLQTQLSKFYQLETERQESRINRESG